jgi:dephospho-CoA kinase
VIVIGLTGSIGMGKTTTAGLFREEGAPVWSADGAVHDLYAAGGAAVAPVRAAFPGVVEDGVVDRTRLSASLAADPDAFVRLEAIVHPLVAHDRTLFLQRVRREGAKVAVLDVPLLFEVGADSLADVVVVASAPEQVQRERVLARPGMDETRLAALLERQLPDAHKRARAHFVIDTSLGLEAAREQVRAVLAAIARPGFQPEPKATIRPLDDGDEPAQ